MSRLIFKGDTANNFGKELPVPYIERIELQNIVGAEDPREAWLTDEAFWAMHLSDNILTSLTKITLKLSIYFNCDDLIQQKPQLIWETMNDNLDLNVLILTGNTDETGAPLTSTASLTKSPIKLLIDSKQYLKKAVYGGASNLFGQSMRDQADEHGASSTLGPLNDEQSTQLAMLATVGAGGTSRIEYAGNYTFSFPLKNQESEVTFSGDFDTDFQRVLKISGIELELFVPSIDSANDLALFVGTSALPFELAGQGQQMLSRTGVASSTINVNEGGKAFALNSSDLAYEYIMKGGSLATKNQEGWFTKKEDDFYTGRPLRALNRKYYKSDDFGPEEIVKNMESVINEYKRFSQNFEEVEEAILNILYTITRFRADPNFLNELNEYRKVYPHKTPDTKAGQLYEDFARAISNSNVLLRRQDELYKKQIRNIKIRDLRPFQYDHVFKGSYAGPDPLPDGSFADVIMDADDFLYRAVPQTTIAKYLEEGDTPYETEFEYDSDELQTAVADTIETLLNRNFYGNLIFRPGSGWGYLKLQEYATNMNNRLKSFRNWMSDPANQYPGGVENVVMMGHSMEDARWSNGTWASGWGEALGSCANQQMRYYAGTSGIEGASNIVFDEGNGEAGFGKMPDDSQLVICRQDYNWGLGCMGEVDRVNYDFDETERTLCDAARAGGVPYSYVNSGPCFILRSINNIFGEGQTGSNWRTYSGWGPRKGWGLLDHDETYNKIMNALRYDHWGPFTSFGSYIDDTAELRQGHVRSRAGATAGPEGYQYESCILRPALMEALHLLGLTGMHTDDNSASDLEGVDGLLYRCAYNLGAYQTFTDGFDMSTDDGRNGLAAVTVNVLLNNFINNAKNRIIQVWGNTPTYKQRFPKQSGRGYYNESEGNPDDLYGYSINAPSELCSSRYTHYRCGGADEWGARWGMVDGWGSHYSWLWRGGPFGTIGSYNSDGGTDTWHNAAFACTERFGHGCGVQSYDFGDTFKYFPVSMTAHFKNSGFMSGASWNAYMPMMIHEENFGNEIMAQCEEVDMYIRDSNLKERLKDIFQLLDLHWGKPIGSGRLNKLAHTDIIANKYGWLFFDLEKYHRKYSNISRYMDIPMALSYYPELREFMNFAIKPNTAHIQYYPQLGDPETDESVVPSLSMQLKHDERYYAGISVGSNDGISTFANSLATCEGISRVPTDDFAGTWGRPPYCKVDAMKVAIWGDFTWNTTSQEFIYKSDNIYGANSGDVIGTETLWSYIMLRNLDLAFTTSTANIASGFDLTETGAGGGITADYSGDDYTGLGLNNMISDNYRLLTYNYNFYVDDDIASGQRDRYRVGIRIDDHSIDLLLSFSEFFIDVYDNFIENYYNLAIENCAFDNVNSKFNTFFGEEMERRYEGDLKHHAPWFAAPALYAVYRDMFQNAYGGDQFLMEDDARSISDSINPTTGFLDALVGFKQRLEDFYDFLVGIETEASSAEHTRDYWFHQEDIMFDQPVVGIVADSLDMDISLDEDSSAPGFSPG